MAHTWLFPACYKPGCFHLDFMLLVNRNRNIFWRYHSLIYIRCWHKIMINVIIVNLGGFWGLTEITGKWNNCYLFVAILYYKLLKKHLSLILFLFLLPFAWMIIFELALIFQVKYGNILSNILWQFNFLNL